MTTVTSLPDYANNPLYQNLPKESDYVSSGDERIYIDLRNKDYRDVLENIRRDKNNIVLHNTLKAVAVEKGKLRIFAYSMVELFTCSPTKVLLWNIRPKPLQRKKSYGLKDQIEKNK